MALPPFLYLSNLLCLQHSLVVLLLLSILLRHSFGLQHPLCHGDDRSSLLRFKQSFIFDEFFCDSSTDHYTKLSSWKLVDDCCSWNGVKCDNQTGHVIGLDLSSSCLYGSINSSSPLFRLIHLTSLDLSDNNFNLSSIPGGIRSLLELKYLELSSANFSGQIPSEIMKLSNLVFLDLSLNALMLQKPSLKELVETLTNLTELDLSGVNISSHVPQSLSNLTSLMSLHLTNCSLQGEFPPSIFQLPNLRVLSLRYNPYLTGYIPEFRVGSPLEMLRLRYTNFSGQLPLSIGNLKSLSYFSVCRCGFWGLIPSSLGNLTKLKALDLSENYFSGNIPSSLSNLFQLTFLSLSNNNFNSGTLHWIAKLTNLESLDMDNTNSYGPIPSSLGNLTQLQLLSLRDNQLNGQLPSRLPWVNLLVLHLSVNKWEGPLPIPPPSILVYDVSQNKFSGDVLPLFCNLTSVLFFDLSNNDLNGNLPPCLGNLGSSTLVLSLRNNGLLGNIPDNFKSGCALMLMDFSQNTIEGAVPKSLANCSKLEILNLEDNRMNDVFPSWLGIIPHLRILSLRSNNFHGAIGQPVSKLEFNRLQIIDLSDNNFTGKLPLHYFRNSFSITSVDHNQLAYMEASSTVDIVGYSWDYQYPYFISIVNKGTERAYNKILEFFVVVDLSSNKFEGEIPEIIGTLKALQSLNLSNNILTGHIPLSLGNLKDLEALDLSLNDLSGDIPIQLSVLTFLSLFNVSYNNLTGPIPRGNQFGTFQNDSFSDNPGLCGLPLSKRCGDTLSLPPSENEDAESPLELNWEIVLTGFGSGLVIGVAFGWALDTRKYEWLARRKFARRRRSRRN